MQKKEPYRDTFYSLRFWIIGIQDNASRLRQDVEGRIERNETFSEEHYYRYLAQMNKLNRDMGLLSSILEIMLEQSKEQKPEEAADETRLNEELDLVLNVQ